MPISHGLGGVPAGLDDVRQRLGLILDGQPDGLILSAGLARALADDLTGRGRPALILTVDRPTGSTLPGKSSAGEAYRLIVPVEDAVRLGADAVKMVMIYGRQSAQVHADNVEAVAHVASECERWGIPLLLEPVLWGSQATTDDREDVQILKHICRMGVEMGADVLKVSYVTPGVREVASTLPVPLIILGGSKTETDAAMFDMVQGAITEGACGVAFGRNVFQRERPDTIIQAIRKIVHRAGGPNPSN